MAAGIYKVKPGTYDLYVSTGRGIDGKYGQVTQRFKGTLQDTRHPHTASANLARALSESEVFLDGDAIDAREPAARPRQYDITPRLLRHGNDVFRGYQHSDFEDAFRRYLPTSGPVVVAFSVVLAAGGLPVVHFPVFAHLPS